MDPDAKKDDVKDLTPEDDTELEQEDTGDDEVKAAKARGDIPNDDVDAKDDVDADEAKEAAADDDDEDDAAAAKAKKDKGISIPKARFDQQGRKAKEREKVLNSRIEQLEQQLQNTGAAKQSPEAKTKEFRTKINELKDKYEELILDGQKTDARKVRNELDELQDQFIDYKTTIRSDAARHQAVDDLKYDAALAKAEGAYPELNPDNDESFDEDKVSEVATLYEAFAARGFKKHVALEKAVKYAMGPVKKEKADASAQKAIKDEKAMKARKKAAAADKKQPGDMSKTGTDSDKAGPADEGGIDVLKLSTSQFEKLNDETKARLRGDTL